MEDAFIPLLWCGGVGWFLLTFLLTCGNDKGWLRNLLVTAFYWLIAVDPIAIFAGIIVPVSHRTGIGWRFVCFFVVLPYVFGVLRVRLLRAHRQRLSPSPPSMPAA
jgi:hypothetical protein